MEPNEAIQRSLDSWRNDHRNYSSSSDDLDRSPSDLAIENQLFTQFITAAQSGKKPLSQRFDCLFFIFPRYKLFSTNILYEQTTIFFLTFP